MRSLLLVLLAPSPGASAASPPAESHERMNAAFPGIVFVNPEGKASGLPGL
jgi:hypothetical protein